MKLKEFLAIVIVTYFGYQFMKDLPALLSDFITSILLSSNIEIDTIILISYIFTPVFYLLVFYSIFIFFKNEKSVSIKGKKVISIIVGVYLIKIIKYFINPIMAENLNKIEDYKKVLVLDQIPYIYSFLIFVLLTLIWIALKGKVVLSNSVSERNNNA